MLERMWQNWDTNALLVELRIDPTILEGNLELCSKGHKRVSALQPSHTTTGPIPQEVINIHSCTFCGGKILENEGMPFNWGMSEQIVVYVGDGILLC